MGTNLIILSFSSFLFFVMTNFTRSFTRVRSWAMSVSAVIFLTTTILIFIAIVIMCTMTRSGSLFIFRMIVFISIIGPGRFFVPMFSTIAMFVRWLFIIKTVIEYFFLFLVLFLFLFLSLSFLRNTETELQSFKMLSIFEKSYGGGGGVRNTFYENLFPYFLQNILLENVILSCYVKNGLFLHAKRHYIYFLLVNSSCYDVHF